MNERGLVEVPENAVRDEPIAFGLTPIQLGICALAVLVAALLNLLPVWEPLRIVFVLVGAGPVALVAALPVRGEPAYRWLVRAVRHLRARRVWQATLGGPDKPQLSGDVDTPGRVDGPSWQSRDNGQARAQSAEGPGTRGPPAAGSPPEVVERAPMEQEVPT